MNVDLNRWISREVCYLPFECRYMCKTPVRSMFVYSSWSLRHRRCSSLSIRQNHELLTYIEFCFTILQSVVCISVYIQLNAFAGLFHVTINYISIPPTLGFHCVGIACPAIYMEITFPWILWSFQFVLITCFPYDSLNCDHLWLEYSTPVIFPYSRISRRVSSVCQSTWYALVVCFDVFCYLSLNIQ